jgi:hypothetical protein
MQERGLRARGLVCSGSSVAFERFAGVCSLLLAFGALVYTIIFIAIVGGDVESSEAWFAILLGGAILIAIYQRLREVDESFALLGLVLALGGAFGGIVHGGYELAAIETAPAQPYYPGLESVDKGALRYLAGGLALIVIGWLIVRTAAALPTGIGYLALAGGALLVFTYFGRLFDFITPGDHVSLIPPVAYGLVVHPLLYGWLGFVFLRSSPPAVTR